MRLIDTWITQLKAQGPCRTCNESKEQEEEATIKLWAGQPIHTVEHDPFIKSQRAYMQLTFGALCGANLVTCPSKISGNEILEVQRVGCLAASSSSSSSSLLSLQVLEGP